MESESPHDAVPDPNAESSFPEEGIDVRAMTPGERIAMMWPLTVRAWAKKGIDVSNTKMERHIVRIIRGKQGQTDVDE